MADNQGFGSKFLAGAGENLSNPNFQSFLAQLGTEIDPQGTGGMLGRATQGMLQREGQQEFFGQLLKMLGGGGKIKSGPDGTVEMTVGQDKDGGSALKQPNNQTRAPEDVIFGTGLTDEDADNWVNNLMGE